MLSQSEKAALRKSEGLRFSTHQWSLDGDARKHLLTLSQTSIRMQKRRRRFPRWAQVVMLAALMAGSALGAYVFFAG